MIVVFLLRSDTMWLIEHNSSYVPKLESHKALTPHGVPFLPTRAPAPPFVHVPDSNENLRKYLLAGTTAVWVLLVVLDEVGSLRGGRKPLPYAVRESYP